MGCVENPLVVENDTRTERDPDAGGKWSALSLILEIRWESNWRTHAM